MSNFAKLLERVRILDQNYMEQEQGIALLFEPNQEYGWVCMTLVWMEARKLDLEGTAIEIMDLGSFPKLATITFPAQDFEEAALNLLMFIDSYSAV